MKLVLVAALFACLTASVSSEEKNAPFTLAVVPSQSSQAERSITMAATQSRTFYVVLTNTSDHAQPVWQTLYSWGFWTISFEFTMPDGKHLHVSRNHNESFTKNSPATFLVPSGEQQIYPVQLDGSWDNLPQFPKRGITRITLKAIYEVGSTPEASQHNVWVGRVESPNYDLVLEHW